MNTTQIKAILSANKGQFFSVVFTKKDGTKREMVCRLGVKKDLSGGTNTVAHIDKYLTVYDMQKHGYRNINCETIEHIKMLGLDLSISKAD